MAVGGRINYEVDDGRFMGQRDNCEMCKTTHYDGYCSQCEIHICQICFDNHLTSKFCNGHVLVQDSNDNTRQGSAIRFELCDEHKQQEVKAYCTEHKCFACIECILLRHKSCKWEYIIKASVEFQSSGELARLLEQVQGIEYTLDTYLEEIDKHTETAEALNKDVVSDIESFGNSLVKYVATSKQHILDDAKERESAHQQRLDKLKNDVQSLGAQVGEILTDFRNEDLSHKRFILAVETMPKVAVIQNELASIDCHNVITDYTFRSNNMLSRVMSNTRPIGMLMETEHGEEDDDDIELKNERERNQSLQQQLYGSQKMVSKLQKDVQGMEKTHANELSKLNKDLVDMNQKYDDVVQEKQIMQQDICSVKSDNQMLVQEKQTLQQEISIQKSANQRVVEENKSLQLEISSLKQIRSLYEEKFIVRLTCGHEHHIVPGRYNRLIKCDTCGIISGDQPDGTYTIHKDGFEIEMTFTFPDGTQSKLNRNPGKPYVGTKLKGRLYNDREGEALLNMMKKAHERKCLFTVDAHGKIQSGVELFQGETWYWSRGKRLFPILNYNYKEYVTRVKKQLEERGILHQ